IWTSKLAALPSCCSRFTSVLQPGKSVRYALNPSLFARGYGRAARMFIRVLLCAFLLWTIGSLRSADQSQSTIRSGAPLRVATFDVDATPPIGSMMAYDPVTNRWDLGLRARGIVVLGAGEPIVLCAFDWIGMANEGHDAFKAALARAAGTLLRRVTVHTL